MRLHRFYISESIGDKKDIVVDSAELANQIFKVFRLKAGDEVVLFDGSGNDYVCTISSVPPDFRLAVARIEKSRYMPKCEVTLCAAIVKKDTFEWIVEKATELGVSKIIPFIAERSEKKALNEERLKKIAIEASEQSGRGDVPVIHPIISLKDRVSFCAENKISAIVFHTEGEPFNGEDFLKESAHKSNALEIFIGPEGGWSESEIELFHANNIPIYSLGPQVLRAETAVVAALSKVLLA